MTEPITSAKQPKQGCKGHYEVREQAAKPAPTFISEVITCLSAATSSLFEVAFRLALLCGMFWLYQFVILSLLGLY